MSIPPLGFAAWAVCDKITEKSPNKRAFPAIDFRCAGMIPVT
jgi:hypothetical protein